MAVLPKNTHEKYHHTYCWSPVLLVSIQTALLHMYKQQHILFFGQIQSINPGIRTHNLLIMNFCKYFMNCQMSRKDTNE